MRVALTSDGGRGDRGTGDSGTVVSPIGALMLFFVSWGVELRGGGLLGGMMGMGATGEAGMGTGSPLQCRVGT